MTLSLQDELAASTGTRSAVLSDCGRYRYTLTRGAGRLLPFVMLNPSTADALQDDPTIRRCVGFAKREGWDGIVVCNLFAFRATKPADMLAADDPVGPENDRYLTELAKPGGTIVCAWGAGAPWDRAARVMSLLEARNAHLFCLGRTGNGSPRHPLYVRATRPLETFS